MHTKNCFHKCNGTLTNEIKLSDQSRVFFTRNQGVYMHNICALNNHKIHKSEVSKKHENSKISGNSDAG
jgi:hypothetical protein